MEHAVVQPLVAVDQPGLRAIREGFGHRRWISLLGHSQLAGHRHRGRRRRGVLGPAPTHQPHRAVPQRRIDPLRHHAILRDSQGGGTEPGALNQFVGAPVVVVVRTRCASVARMDLGLRGRIALVVGGTGLIGRAVVERLREEGATVVAASRHIAEGISIDATDPRSVTAALDAVVERHGRLDALVVAAAPRAQTLDASRHADPEQVLDAINAKALSFLRVANEAIPLMLGAGYGRIVGVSGQNAFLTGDVAGSVRNAALIVAAKNLADGIAGSGVTINTVSPGAVSPSPASEVEPGRGGESSPEQIADLIAFLVSPRAATISGESIAIGHRVRGVTSL